MDESKPLTPAQILAHEMQLVWAEAISTDERRVKCEALAERFLEEYPPKAKAALLEESLPAATAAETAKDNQ